MPSLSSPLLDDYNRTGVVTPALQKAMDRFKQRMPQATGPTPYNRATGDNLGGNPAMHDLLDRPQLGPKTLPYDPKTGANLGGNPAMQDALDRPALHPAGPAMELVTNRVKPMEFPPLLPPSPMPVPQLPMVGQLQAQQQPAQAQPEPAKPMNFPPLAPPQHTPLAGLPTPAANAHKAELARLTTGDTGKSGIAQIHNPWLRGLATAGDIALSTFLPAAAALTPGTAYHHQALVNQQRGLVDLDDSLANNETKRRLENAQATEQESLPEFHQAQAENAATKNENTRLTAEAERTRKEASDKSRNAVSLAQHGFKMDEQGNIVPLPYEEMSQDQQAVHDLKVSQAETQASIQALNEAKAKNQPQLVALAQKRLDSAKEAHAIALRRLNLSEKTYEARYHGTENGEALPGAMLTEDGTPVGTANAANVRPTNAQRNKGDLANSAAEQIADIKAIVKKRPDIFGPAAGRTTDFNVWVGSQDPDAQRFRTARTIASDHLAGVFGGRSETALHALDDAIGRFKDNPEAIEAGLDQVVKGNEVFQKSGKVKTAPSGNKPNQPPTVNTQAEYDALPKGAEYIEGGKRYRKP